MQSTLLGRVGWLALLAVTTAFVAIVAAHTVGAARSGPDLRPVLGEPPCAAPCWRNITPGITPLLDAVQAIYGDPALEDLSVNVRSATWWWNGKQPVALSHRPRPFDGRMIFENDSADSTVDGLALMTSLTLGDLYSVLGPPQRHVLYFPPEPSNPGAVYAAQYRHLTIFSTLQCPLDPADFWGAEAGVVFGEISLELGGETTTVRGSPQEPIRALMDHCTS